MMFNRFAGLGILDSVGCWPETPFSLAYRLATTDVRDESGQRSIADCSSNSTPWRVFRYGQQVSVMGIGFSRHKALIPRPKTLFAHQRSMTSRS